MSNADILDTRFRSALRRMLEAGRLRAYEGKADPRLEIAAVMKTFDGEDAAILFGDVAGHDVPVVGNVLSNKLNCEAAFGCDFRAIRDFIGRAIGGPLPPVVVERAPAHEQVHRNGFDIGAMLPVLTHTPDDGGRFITAGVVIARDPETGVYNASYHRLQLLGAEAHRDQARLRPPPAPRLRARQGEGRAPADRRLHRRRHRAAVHRRHHGLADAGERRRDRGRRRAVRAAAAGGARR